jgi:hypothetical protein
MSMRNGALAPKAPGVWTFGKGFSSQDGHTLPTFALRPEGPWELSPGRRRCALARPGLASGIAESPGRDVGLAESGFSLG